MMKRFTIRRQIISILTITTAGLASHAFASGFQLWEQDGASVGNYHAGRAAIAEDASTNFYNPAGLVRIHNQQLIVGGVPILTNFIYKGTVAVNNLGDTPVTVTDQGGGFNFAPDLHYAAPITDKLVFGFSVVSPFGLKTDYGNNTNLRYAATLSSLQVIDAAPSLGYAINDHISLGAGLDIERARSEFDLVATAFDSSNDTDGGGEGWSTALGFHAGVLFQFSEQTRLGMSYQSKVKHRLRGHSTFVGPLANDVDGGEQYSGNYFTAVTLPATSSLSIFHVLNPRVDLMGTITYTQWDVFKDVVMDNVAAIEDGESSNTVTVIIPENYKNTWNYSIGGNIHVNERFFIRTGLGYDQSPSNDQDRDVQLPDGDRVAVALGGHFQATKTLALDLSWTHFFEMNPPIDVSQTIGDQTTTTVGSVNANADVYGLQIKWDIS
jgi:long-chain fatty acid transport protein